MTFGRITLKRLPYEGTVIDADKTQAEISTLLDKYGAIGVQWTTLRGNRKLEFIIEVEVKGIQRELAIIYEPPPIEVKRKGVRSVDWNLSMRLLYWHLKSKLEAISYGLVSAEREFSSNIKMRLPGGQTGTVGDILESAIANEKLDNLLPDESNKERLTDADARVIEQ